MEFEQLYDSLILTERSILGLVDEYTLYCFYTGIDNMLLNTAYQSPYRVDNRPSFSVFETKFSIGVEYFWKDSATGEVGNIFKLIELVESLSRQDVLAKINEDFELGYDVQVLEPREKIIKYIRPTPYPIKLRIAPIPFTEAGSAFWKQYNIGPELLTLYNVEQIRWYWSYAEQQAPMTVPDPAFSYRIGAYYQIYSPLAPKLYKFRTDLPETYFFGYQQLTKSGEKLILDKSCKDVIFCRKLGYEAIAPKSESTMIPHEKMFELKQRFTNIYLTLDPDPCGHAMTAKYLELYPWLKARFLTDVKDKSDACKLYGYDKAKIIIDELLV